MLGENSYTITRKVAGSWSDIGVWTDGATSAISIQATMRPATGQELEMLEEGQRQKTVVVLYSSTELKNEDTFVLSSETYEIIQVDRNNRHGFLSHYKAMAIKEKE